MFNFGEVSVIYVEFVKCIKIINMFLKNLLCAIFFQRLNLDIKNFNFKLNKKFKFSRKSQISIVESKKWENVSVIHIISSINECMWR